MTRRPRSLNKEDVLAAIDVGTNAIRLEVARVLPDGALETMHTERDPVRPGEGLFKSGMLSREVERRLTATLSRYAALCRRYGARVRAVATSALREARNRNEIVRRIKKETGLTLEVVSGREEARLISLGVLHDKPPTRKSLCIDIGGGSTEVIFALGFTPKDLWSVELGAVRMTELFEVRDEVPKKKLKLMRNFAREILDEAIPHGIPGAPTTALGSSGTIGAVVAFARSEGVGHATTQEITWAVEELADMGLVKRRRRFDPRRADIVVAGAVILEAILKHLRLSSVTAVDRGLREGLLRDLVQRRRVDPSDASLAQACVAVGRRFNFGEAHAKQVARLSLVLFDELASLHKLPASARPFLEAAATLHDIGHVVNHQRHHKHSAYLIQNVDLPGLTEHERALVALIARFHRRSRPELDHELMDELSPGEARLVRKCATLLRVADSLDRSHHQPVQSVHVQMLGRTVVLKVKAKHSIELEQWDVAQEAPLFRDVFARTLVMQARR